MAIPLATQTLPFDPVRSATRFERRGSAQTSRVSPIWILSIIVGVLQTDIAQKKIEIAQYAA
jgi:hypothetical protein